MLFDKFTGGTHTDRTCELIFFFGQLSVSGGLSEKTTCFQKQHTNMANTVARLAMN